MRLDNAPSPVVFANPLKFGLNIGEVVVSVGRSFVFHVVGTLEIILTAMILLGVYVRSKSNMRSPLIKIYCFYLVAIVGYIVFEVVTALVVFIIDDLVLLTLAHESSLPLIVEGRRGLSKNDVATLATSGIVVGIRSFRSVDAFPVFGVRALGRTFDLAQMILLLGHAIITSQLPLVSTSDGTSPAVWIYSGFITAVIVALVNVSRKPGVIIVCLLIVLFVEFSIIRFNIASAELGRVDGLISDSPHLTGLFGVL